MDSRVARRAAQGRAGAGNKPAAGGAPDRRGGDSGVDGYREVDIALLKLSATTATCARIQRTKQTQIAHAALERFD